MHRIFTFALQPVVRTVGAFVLACTVAACYPGAAPLEPEITFGQPGPVYAPADVDNDGDGVNNAEDCNDNDANIFPGNPEVECDGVDQNCDSVDYVDDLNRSVSPCGGTDDDGDGYMNENGDGDTIDCNDDNAAIHPDAVEIIGNNVDEDCDGVANQTPVDNDADNDGVDDDLDCADNNASIHPGATEIPYDGIDQNCDGEDLDDVDCDGYGHDVDCDDTLLTGANVNPGATEILGNNIDDDCDLSTPDSIAPPMNTDCDGQFSRVSGSFTAPVGATNLVMYGTREGLNGAIIDDAFPFGQFANGSPTDMVMTASGRTLAFELDRCVADTDARWRAVVSYQLAGQTLWDCNVHQTTGATTFTGIWAVDYDDQDTAVTRVINSLGGCEATWTRPMP